MKEIVINYDPIFGATVHMSERKPVDVTCAKYDAKYLEYNRQRQANTTEISQLHRIKI